MDNNDKSSDFLNFGVEFEKKVLALLLKTKSFTDYITPMLKEKYFTKEYLRVMYQKIKSFENDYESFPTVDSLEIVFKNLYKKDLETAEAQLTFKTLAFIKEYNGKFQADLNFIKKEVKDFCVERNYQNAFLKMMYHFKKKEYDLLEPTLKQASKQSNYEKTWYNYTDKLSIQERFINERKERVTTGFKEIDKITGNGLERSQIGIIAAPSGMGKSIFLCNVSANAFKAGYNILYYTFELTPKIVAQRIDSVLLDVGFNNLSEHPKLVSNRLIDLFSKIKGKLRIMDYVGERTTLASFEANINQVCVDDFKPDIIIVDYLDYLFDPTSKESSWFILEELVKNLRDLGKDHNCVIWTASQVSGNKGKEKNSKRTQMAGSSGKIRPADLVVTISDDAVVSVEKNRNGPSYVNFDLISEITLGDRTKSRMKMELNEIVDENTDGYKQVLKLNKKEENPELREDEKELQNMLNKSFENKEENYF